MKRGLAVAIASFLIGGSGAWAQAVIEIEPEQRTVIREYVVKQKPAPAKIKTELRVGVAVPKAVALRTVPKNWGPRFQKYRYVYWNDRVVLIEPDSRNVVHIIEVD